MIDPEPRRPKNIRIRRIRIRNIAFQSIITNPNCVGRVQPGEQSGGGGGGPGAGRLCGGGATLRRLCAASLGTGQDHRARTHPPSGRVLRAGARGCSGCRTDAVCQGHKDHPSIYMVPKVPYSIKSSVIWYQMYSFKKQCCMVPHAQDKKAVVDPDPVGSETFWIWVQNDCTGSRYDFSD